MPEPPSHNEPLITRLLAEFLVARDAGKRPEVAVYLAQLKTDADRQEFQEQLKALGWAEQHMPSSAKLRAPIDGRYELMDELGAGGFGKVWAARALHLEDKPVAVKILNGLSLPADASEQLRWEVSSLSKLQHPAVVTLLDTGEHQGDPYLVMERIDGVSLAYALREVGRERAAATPAARHKALRDAIGRDVAAGRGDLIGGDWWETAARIQMEILSGLAAAHAAGVVHRDIKPANVMLQGGGNPVVLDFGVAGLTREARDGVTSRLFGSVNYVAPEQARASRTGKDTRTDIYQAGLLLYEMLVLQPAFPLMENVGDTLERIRNTDFKRPRERDPTVPRGLDDICMHALEGDPQRRYQSVEEFLEDLRCWLAGEPPRYLTMSPTRRRLREVRRFLARNRAKVAVTFAALGGVTATLLVLLAAQAQIAFAAPPTLAGDTVAARISAEVPGRAFALAIYRGRNGRERVVPLRPVGGSDGYSVATSPGEVEVTWQPPELVEAPLDNPTLQFDLAMTLFSQGQDQEAARYAELVATGVERLRDDPLTIGIPMDEWSQLAQTIAGRSRGDGPSIDSAPLLPDSGQWIRAAIR